MCRHKSLKALLVESRNILKTWPRFVLYLLNQDGFQHLLKISRAVILSQETAIFCWRFVLLYVIVCGKCGVKFVLRVAVTVGIRGS